MSSPKSNPPTSYSSAPSRPAPSRPSFASASAAAAAAGAASSASTTYAPISSQFPPPSEYTTAATINAARAPTDARAVAAALPAHLQLGNISARAPLSSATTASSSLAASARTTATAGAPTAASTLSSITSSIRPSIASLSGNVSSTRPTSSAAAAPTSPPRANTSNAYRNANDLSEEEVRAPASRYNPLDHTLHRPPATPSTTSSIISSSSSDTSSIASTPATTRHPVLSPHSSKLLSAVTTKGGDLAKQTFVHRSAQDEDLLNLTYGSQIVLRVCTGKFVTVEENNARDRAPETPRWTVHGSSPNAYSFTILNAAHLSDRSEVKFLDSVVLLSADGTFLSAEGQAQSNLPDEAPVGAHRSDLGDVRTKWYILSGQNDIVGSGGFSRARGVVKIFDQIVLKSFLGTLLTVDELDINGGLHHRERNLRAVLPPPTSASQISAPPPLQPSILSLARAHLPLVPDWLRSRGGSLSVAPPGSSLVVSEQFLPDSKPLGDFNDMPSEIQEQLLLEDLLYALAGIEGKYIRLIQQENQEEKIAFVASPYIKDKSLIELLNRFLPIAQAYFNIHVYIQIHSRWEYGLITHALSSAMRTILKEYLVLLAQLEFQFSSGKLTLLRAWYYLQPCLHSLLKLEKICSIVNRTTGGTLLNALYRQMQMAGDKETKDLYTHLLKSASAPYFEMLNLWLTQGIIHDAYDEFQIKQRADMDKENVRKDYNDTYWDGRYAVKTERVPTFLEQFTDRILTTGKYLNVIRECGRAIPAAPSTAALSYSANERLYMDVIDSCYEFASRLLLDLLMTENDLLGRLRSIKRYFLCAQGDFFVHFMDITDAELRSTSNEIMLPKLKSLLELALRTSRANTDPYLSDLSCFLGRYTLLQKLDAIHSVTAVQQRLLPDAMLKGNDAITLSYRVRWPLSLVLSKKTLTKYQLLFRHLFSIKHAERQLNACWVTHQSLKELTLRTSYHATFGLRHRMLHFFQNMAYYIMIEVLEPNWHELEQKLLSVTTVDEVLRSHHAFLDQCLKQCLLTSQSILRILHKMMSTAFYFCQHEQTSISPQRDNNELDMDSDEEEQYTTARSSSHAYDSSLNPRKPMTLKQREKHIQDKMHTALKSIQDPSHVNMVKELQEKFDKLLFEFLSNLRAKSASPSSSDSHFGNLYNRLDYNDWYSTYFQHAAVKQPAPSTSSAAGQHAR